MAFDDRETVLNEICIGRSKLKQFCLDYQCAVPQELCYELYCVPSHNEQTYYAQISKRADGYYLSYAKPVLEDRAYGQTITMFTLKNAVEANDKSRYRGKIVCGIKKVETAFADYLGNLFSYLPEGSHWNEDCRIGIDGTFQMIRVYADGKVLKEAAFHNKPSIVRDKDIQIRLESLHQIIENETTR